MTTAFLFPGQGSQVPGMLQQLPDHQAVAETVEEASSVLNSDVLQYDTADAQGSTVAVQIALLVSGVAMARVLMREGGKPAYVAGHSVGAFGAAVVSGVLSFRDALFLVKLRADLMEQVFPSGYGMGVIAGMVPWQVQELIDQAFSKGEQVYLANLNAAQQVTIAGTIQGIRLVLKTAKAVGARKAELLRVAVPSHCPLLEPVASSLRDFISHISLNEPLIPYAANTTARLVRTSGLIRDDLVRSIAEPVRWHDMTTQLVERGTRIFIEMPPGHVLSSLARSSHPSARAVAASEIRVDSLLYLMI